MIKKIIRGAPAMQFHFLEYMDMRTKLKTFFSCLKRIPAMFFFQNMQTFSLRRLPENSDTSKKGTSCE